MTMAEFNQIIPNQTTLVQVQQMVGTGGTVQSENSLPDGSGGTLKTQDIMFDGNGAFSNASITVQNGVVVSKTQLGLQ